ncbi:MAG: hypothetical protein K5931_04435, partial [Lachnospiraceae bacterium]|nr:hypothetical protein [Lachnospiraceae bacterium]
EAKRLEAERREAEMAEAKRKEAERLEADKAEVRRIAAMKEEEAKKAAKEASARPEDGDREKLLDEIFGKAEGQAANESSAAGRQRAIKKVNDKIIIKSDELKKPSLFGKKESDPNKTELSESLGGSMVSDGSGMPGEGKNSGFSMKKGNSSNWRYDSSDFPEESGFFESFFRHMTGLHWAMAAMAVMIFITGAMTTGVYAAYKGEQNRAIALASLERYADDDAEILQTVSEEELPKAAEEPEEVELVPLNLVLTSVEKDLKIKLVDNDDTLVKDLPWSVAVSDGSGQEKIAEDEDRDGVIHITDMSAGDYSVEIVPNEALAGYVLPSTKQVCSVKATVEYKVIANIKEEIKSEKEVNVAAEDTGGNRPADVETGTAPTDTVEWCESTKTAGGEEYVEAKVDLTKLTAVSKKNNLLAAIDKIKDFSNKIVGGKVLLGAPVFLVDTVQEKGESYEAPAEEGEENSEEGSAPVSEPTAEVTEAAPAAEPTEAATPTPEATATAEPAKEESTPEATATPTPTPTPTATAAVEADMVTATATPTPTATATPASETNYSRDAQLYDSAKNPLYISVDGEYRLAKYGDYLDDPGRKFYRKTDSYLYTGWQTIDGVTYYYKSDHTYVTGTQVIQGVTYTFSDNGALAQGSGTLGIDVSKYQPSINWSSVKASGIDFVIIRCGYRGASTGVLIQDPYYTSHIKGAKAAGLKVGIYFFSTALNEAEAVEEASMCVALASGYGVNYPIFIDVESSSRPGYDSLPASQRTTNIKAFCSTVKSAGYSAGVYANKTWLSSYMDASALSGYKIWLAQYNASGPTYKGKYDLWQYTSKGSVGGISGNVDMNHSYLGY